MCSGISRGNCSTWYSGSSLLTTRFWNHVDATRKVCMRRVSLLKQDMQSHTLCEILICNYICLYHAHKLHVQYTLQTELARFKSDLYWGHLPVCTHVRRPLTTAYSQVVLLKIDCVYAGRGATTWIQTSGFLQCRQCIDPWPSMLTILQTSASRCQMA